MSERIENAYYAWCDDGHEMSLNQYEEWLLSLPEENERLRHITGEMEIQFEKGRVVPVEKGFVPPWPQQWFQFWCNCTYSDADPTAMPVALNMYETQRLIDGDKRMRIFVARCPKCKAIYRAVGKE